MFFPSSHRWTLCVTPKSPKGWLKTRIFTLGVAFHAVWVRHSKSQPMDNKMSLKGAWSLSCDLFNFWKISHSISKMEQDSLIVSIKFVQEVVCTLSNGYVANDLPWPLIILNHLNFYFLGFMHLRNWWSQRLQIWCTGWMGKSQPTDDKPFLIGAWSGHVTLKILGVPIIYHWNDGT